MIQKIIHIARSAGSIILNHYQTPTELLKKEGGSPLTLADLEANRKITSELAELDANIPIISEESELPPFEVRKNWDRFWLVDPLDGTAEFLEKNGEFTVNIALIENGEPILGVIFVPALSLLYWAQKDQGSWKVEGIGKPVRIFSREPDPTGLVKVVGSRRHGTGALDKFLKSFSVEELLPAGSSLKFCLVAEGKADLYPRLGPTMEWDVAAGDCIYRNSAPKGQRKTSLTYNKENLKNGNFVLGLSDDRSIIGAQESN